MVSYILDLPPEIVDAILDHLTPNNDEPLLPLAAVEFDQRTSPAQASTDYFYSQRQLHVGLSCLSKTCRFFRQHAQPRLFRAVSVAQNGVVENSTNATLRILDRRSDLLTSVKKLKLLGGAYSPPTMVTVPDTVDDLEDFMGSLENGFTTPKAVEEEEGKEDNEAGLDERDPFFNLHEDILVENKDFLIENFLGRACNVTQLWLTLEYWDPIRYMRRFLFLHQLQELVLCGGHYYAVLVNATALQALLQKTPVLHTLRCAMIQGPPAGSICHASLRTLELHKSFLSYTGLVCLMTGLPKLETFTYLHSRLAEIDGRKGQEEGPVTVVQLCKAMQIRRDTLKRLSFVCGSHAGTHDEVPSLADMQVLQFLSFPGRDKRLVTSSKQILVDLLPSSIRTLSVFDAVEEATEPLRQLALSAPARFPLLKEVYLKNLVWENVRDEVEPLFNAAGISCQLFFYFDDEDQT